MTAAALVPAIARRAFQLTFLRYIFASVGALAADMGVFLLLLATGRDATISSALSYGGGVIVHWLISSRLVFVRGARTTGTRRVKQKAYFVASALVGLAMTVMIVASGSATGIDPRLSKLAAIIASFLVTYCLRKTLVFSAG